MSENHGKARHRRRKTAVVAGVPLTLAAAGTMAYGTVFGVFGADAQPRAAAAAPTWATASADGFASVNALGQNGTYGGRDGRTVTVKTLADLEKYATAAEPYVIVVAATIDMNPVGKEIRVASDKTIVGSGTSGHIVGGGFFLGQGVHNVVIRNLTIRDSYQGTWNDKDHDFDAIQMDGAHHVWIDHNDLRHMADGLIDSRKDTTYVTVSWNKLSQNNKTFGIGWTTNTTADLTIHHNWFRDTEQRNPSTDNVAHAHLYNNFLEDVSGTDIASSYGNYARGNTKMVLENSYFQGMRNPVTKDATAALVQRGNVFSGTSGRNESGGTAFDPKTYYGYTLDKAADVPALLKSGAGPRSSIGTTATTKAAAATTLTVAKDGSGQFTSVQKAVDAVPANNPSRVVISVKPGTYRELVKVPSNKPHVTIQGSGGSRKDTTIVYNNASGTPKPGGGTYGTGGSATVAVEADDFQARNLTISNDFDEAANQSLDGHQAVALRTAADKVLLDGVIVSGDQDTLLLDTASKDKLGRVYVTNSYVIGNVDFIFGRATAVVDRSVITLKKRWNGTSAGYVTAPSTAANRKGFLITDSTVNGDVSDRSFHLGRPWHAGGDASLDPQTTVRNTSLSAAIRTAPWTDMSGFSWKDDRFAEYKNTGPGAGGASTDRPHLTDAQAAGQEVADWLAGWTPSA
ncbi:pectinesterase family protein [Streptomyces stelliscabiei]|uniref:Pectinesterase n=1 Tax=Streptomyces stelliscabiei TaxID=146820 RepID=A0A8I0NZE4_9ACTN|nr:pectinesterase family protein [Streptomyces stelliscabiei]KND45959.1 pectate lyase [Streptomyces stelliscabiei]MBE1595345.1 pectinesterase [Streptomyces stelliscabiei]MDX2516298.1 pectinesterase family protein [Streptomyces stelliscabiei]MDX2557849.1 pectinesterase family protein [Streptomyces stelliscabiei]MDX2612257.1 pectinesterase family protein [Streptomyces stelliscabiei]